MEYYYTMMYSLAPASQAPEDLKLNTGTTSQSAEDPMSVFHFAQQATQASYALLTLVIDILQPTGLLPYLPVRCWLFIVAASLHLLKVIAVLAYVQLWECSLCSLARNRPRLGETGPSPIRNPISFLLD